MTSPYFVKSQRLDERNRPKRYDDLLDMIGSTPLVRLVRLTRDLPDTVQVFVKLETMNPSGSVKDRAARQIINDAIERGDLGQGQTLLDATNGNTGISYAMLGAALGLDVHLVMPENVSRQRKEIVTTFGAKITYSDAAQGSDGAIRLARKLAADDKTGRYFYADQYNNPSNPRAHQITTAPELWAQTKGEITHFVVGIGTSATLMGTGRGLKEFNSKIKIIGVQPTDSLHAVEGLKHLPSSMKPEIYNEEELDDLLWLETEQSWDMAEQMARQEGIACGYSSGANVAAALEVARCLKAGTVVTVICDHSDRYFGG